MYCVAREVGSLSLPISDEQSPGPDSAILTCESSQPAMMGSIKAIAIVLKAQEQPSSRRSCALPVRAHGALRVVKVVRGRCQLPQPRVTPFRRRLESSRELHDESIDVEGTQSSSVSPRDYVTDSQNVSSVSRCDLHRH